MHSGLFGHLRESVLIGIQHTECINLLSFTVVLIHLGYIVHSVYCINELYINHHITPRVPCHYIN